MDKGGATPPFFVDPLRGNIRDTRSTRLYVVRGIAILHSRVILRSVLLCVAWLLAAPAAAAPGNALAGHASPYLALHGDDPVAWQEWNAATLARAKRENKLLFVSVGYFSCHWCHVMQRESYRDPAIAALLNRHFIPVKVDRELNGALDAALVEFAGRLRGVSGWPLNAFVTPEGYPAYAVLYVPPTEFRALLERLAQNWREHPQQIRAAAREAAPQPAPAKRQTPTPELLREREHVFLAEVWRQADTLQGGFARVSKFPMAPHLARLLEIQAREDDPRLAEFLELTLEQMARRGLRDHVNGGFFRYTVDPDWHIPHFEKMLADNAQLASVYARAAEVLRRPDYRQIAMQTLDFLLATLAAPGGGFFTATSALDRRGREGGAYLWSPAELKKRLSPADYALAARVWRLERAADFPLGHLLFEWIELGAGERERIQSILGTLKAAGRQRQVPVDRKINAGLNGLALSAFARAGKGVPRHERAARELAAFLAGRMLTPAGLLKTRVGERVFSDAELEDYAFVVAGLTDFGAAFDDTRSLRLARELAAEAWRRFFGEQGWRREERPLLATLRPQPALADAALPSAAAVLMSATRLLLHIQADERLAASLRTAEALALPAMTRAPFAHASTLAALSTR